MPADVVRCSRFHAPGPLRSSSVSHGVAAAPAGGVTERTTGPTGGDEPHRNPPQIHPAIEDGSPFVRENLRLPGQQPLSILIRQAVPFLGDRPLGRHSRHCVRLETRRTPVSRPARSTATAQIEVVLISRAKATNGRRDARESQVSRNTEYLRMRTRNVPRGARHLRTYAELDSYLHDFVLGLYPFLWIVGRPGTTKTESLKTALRGRPCLYRKGLQLTPLQFHLDLYRHRGEPVVLDDADPFMSHKVGKQQVSSLGDTSPTKPISYASTTRALGDVPQTFHTTSPLCVITNKGTVHEDIQSRAVILYFDPTNEEVHRAVARWYWDQEIHDWFGQHLRRLPPLDARWYVIAHQDKRSLRDWRQIVLKTHAASRASCVVQDLEQNPAYPTREDKARRFVELLGEGKGASRASYFRLRRRLEDAQQLVVEAVPPIPLRRTRPPGTPSLLELDAQEVPFPAQAEEETYPLDVPAREQFARPIRGDGAARTTPNRPALDDSVSWEGRPGRDEEGEE